MIEISEDCLRNFLLRATVEDPKHAERVRGCSDACPASDNTIVKSNILGYYVRSHWSPVSACHLEKESCIPWWKLKGSHSRGITQDSNRVTLQETKGWKMHTGQYSKIGELGDLNKVRPRTSNVRYSQERNPIEIG